MLVPIILAGGIGSRLWPLSRESSPKQLLPLVDELTMLQGVLLRLRQVVDAVPPVIICQAQHRFVVAEQVRQVGVAISAIIVEPEGRGTAPAITLGALYVAENFPTAKLLVLPTDHVINDHDKFAEAIAKSLALINDERLLTFGVPPNYAETAYGYLKLGETLCKDSYIVDSFVEKPDRQLAQQYVASHDYLWNTGIFMFSAKFFLHAQESHAADMLAACQQALLHCQQDEDFIRPQSIDCATSSMEYLLSVLANALIVVRIELDWSDVGSWDTLANMQSKTQEGNVLQGDVWTEGVNNSYLHAEHRLLAVVGVQDHIIVETRDAVLVAHKDKCQSIKNLVFRLKQANRQEVFSHQDGVFPINCVSSIVPT